MITDRKSTVLISKKSNVLSYKSPEIQEPMNKPMSGFRANLVKVNIHSPMKMKIVGKWFQLWHDLI